MIRVATHADFEGIFQLCIKAHSESIYSSLKADEQKIRTYIARAVSGPQVFCWVSEIDNEIVGLMVGDITEPMYSKEKIAGDLIFYVSRGGEGPLLLNQLRDWYRKKGVSMGQISVSFGGDDIERVGKMLLKAGFQRAGGIYVEFL